MDIDGTTTMECLLTYLKAHDMKLGGFSIREGGNSVKIK